MGTAKCASADPTGGTPGLAATAALGITVTAAAMAAVPTRTIVDLVHRVSAMKIVKIVGVLLIVGVAALAVTLFLRAATHDLDWVQAQARLPQIAIDGERVVIENIRDFSYAADRTVTDAAYYDRAYDLGQLTSVWYGVSHFAELEGLAHTFLSFGFADGTYLALSIEARREVGEAYGPVKGLFRNYELIYVLADERDIIGARSHIRGERVQLYRLDLPSEARTRLFRAMLAEAQALNAEPRFYNTFVDNCTTGIVKHARRVPAWQRFIDYRIILPGYSDGLAYGLGLIGAGQTLAEARARATIDPAQLPLDAPDFSAALRLNLG